MVSRDWCRPRPPPIGSPGVIDGVVVAALRCETIQEQSDGEAVVDRTQSLWLLPSVLAPRTQPPERRGFRLPEPISQLRERHQPRKVWLRRTSRKSWDSSAWQAMDVVRAHVRVVINACEDASGCSSGPPVWDGHGRRSFVTNADLLGNAVTLIATTGVVEQRADQLVDGGLLVIPEDQVLPAA